MIIRSLSCRNFKRFESLEVPEFPREGLVGILGMNESGKSTMGEVISYSLFGRTPTAGTGQTRTLLRWGAPFFETRLRFEISGMVYLVYRRFRQDGPTECYLMDEAGGEELAVGDEGVTERIGALLGMGFEEFRHSLYVAQNELSLITDPRVRRKDVLEGMLGLERLREVDRRVAQQIKELQDEQSLDHIRMEEVQRLDEEVNRVQREIQGCLEKRDALQSERSAHVKKAAELEEHLKEMEEQRGKLRDVESSESLLMEKREALKALEEQLGQISLIELKIEELDREEQAMKGQAQRIREEQMEIKRKLHLYEGFEDLKRRLDQRKEELARLQTRLDEIRAAKNDMDTAENLIQARTAMLEEHLNFLERYPTLETFHTRVEKLSLRYEAVRERYGRFRGRVLSEVQRLDQLLAEQTARLKEARAALGTPGELVDQEEIAALEDLLEDTGGVSAVAMGITLGTVVAVSLVGVLVHPAALAGLVLLGVPFQMERSRQVRVKGDRARLRELRRKAEAQKDARREYDQAKTAADRAQAEVDRTTEALSYHRRLLAFWDDLPIGTLREVRETATAMAEFRDSLTDELLTLLKQFLTEIGDLAKFLKPSEPLEVFLSGGHEAIYRRILSGRDEVHAEITELKKRTMNKVGLLREYEQALNQAAEAKQVVETMQKEVPAFRLPGEPLEGIRELYDQKSEELQATLRRQKEVAEEREERRVALTGKEELQQRRARLLAEIGKETEALYQRRQALPADDLSDTSFDQLLENLERHKEAVHTSETEEARLEGRREQLEETLRRLNQRQKEENRIAQRLNLLSRREEELLLLRECLATTVDRARKRILPQIRAYFSHILARLTGGRYSEVELDEDFNVTVYSPERGAMVDISHLSGGTADQLFIALRLALARSTSTGGEGAGRPFLFLDEPLSAFDSDRRVLFFELLRAMKPNFQQLFLISHLPGISDYLDHHLTLAWDGGTLAVHKSWEPGYGGGGPAAD